MAEKCHDGNVVFDGEAEAALQSIEKKIGELSPAQAQPSIYKVHMHLHDVNGKAYEPEIVAIGPYHHGKDNLKMMEEHKLRYLKALVERKPDIKIKDYISAVAGIEHTARNCYAEPIGHNAAKFIEMLVLDGCFIIELMLKDERIRNSTDRGRDNDPIFETLWITTSLQRDLVLFENQIPFFVLCKLFDLIEAPDQHKRLMELVLVFFWGVFPGEVEGNGTNSSSQDGKLFDLVKRSINLTLFFFQSLYFRAVERKGASGSAQDVKHVHDLLHTNRSSQDVKHILDLLHSNWSCSSDTGGAVERNSRTNSNSPDVEHGYNSRSCTSDSGDDVNIQVESDTAGAVGRNGSNSNSPDVNNLLVQLQSNCSSASDDNDDDDGGCDVANKDTESDTVEGESRFIHTATELKEANVEFRALKEANTLFDIDFNSAGTMSMPPLRVEDRTESVFRNLIAYEQYFPNDRPTSFTDYAQLLDCLINSSTDVKILTRCGIIENWLGDNEAIVAIFNKITDSVTLADQFVHADTFRLINAHCQRRRNRAIAKLKRDYFNSRWAYVSFFAALLLLLLTIAQTVLSALQMG